jgi:hypothetical protein
MINASNIGKIIIKNDKYIIYLYNNSKYRDSIEIFKNKNPFDYKIIKDWINDIKFGSNIH